MGSTCTSQLVAVRTIDEIYVKCPRILLDRGSLLEFENAEGEGGRAPHLCSHKRCSSLTVGRALTGEAKEELQIPRDSKPSAIRQDSLDLSVVDALRH